MSNLPYSHQFFFEPSRQAEGVVCLFQGLLDSDFLHLAWILLSIRERIVCFESILERCFQVRVVHGFNKERCQKTWQSALSLLLLVCTDLPNRKLETTSEHKAVADNSISSRMNEDFSQALRYFKESIRSLQLPNIFIHHITPTRTLPSPTKENNNNTGLERVETIYAPQCYL